MDFKKIFKRINKSVLVLFCMILGFVSCYDKGYEEFVAPTGNVNNIQPNTLFTAIVSADDSSSMVFRSYSTDAASYLWDFGDGNTSTEANPNYTYEVGGLFTVTLTTTSSDGLVAEDSSDVSPISIDFDFRIIDSEVTFENLTSGASSLVWDFGDEETLEWDAEDSEEDPNFNPVHIYKTAENFSATLTATNFLGEQVSVTKNIEGLVLSTVPDFTFVASGFTVNFTDASILAVSHSWDFGDGNTSTEVNPTHMYAAEGTYDVTLTTTNDVGVSKSITQGIPIGAVVAIDPEIIHGDLDLDDSATSNAWKIANSASGRSDPFGRSADGSCTDYDGVATGSKTRGAKWSSSQGALDINGGPVAGDTRYAYQAVTLSPNTDYVFEYEYAIRTGGADTNRVVGLILNGHFDDSDVALATNALVEHVGTVALGKFSDNSCSGGTLVQETFKSNAAGEVAIFFYTFNDVDSYVDNVKIYPAP